MPESPSPRLAAPRPDGQPLRVVLVEDDPLVRQLLTMVWDDYLLDLQPCSSVAQALAALRTAPADLIVTDLMLPGASGLDLLAHLAAEPALRAQARVAVFSAGIDATTAARLQTFGVWRVLRKPLPVGELQDCVQDAGATLRPAAGAAAEAGPEAAAAPQPSAIDSHFGGNATLFNAFRVAAQQQFAQDLAAGDAALQAADAPALQRLAHSLKSVLLSLGHTSFGQLAAALETSAGLADWPAARPQWLALRRALAELARSD